MTAPSSRRSRPRQAKGRWSRLTIPLLLLLVAFNVVFFAGNAILDLWQTFGPGTHFTGTITDHQQTYATGESGERHNLLTIDTDHGPLKFDVYDKTYADTHTGQRVTGELDARTLLGHTQGLRELTADSTEVFTTQSAPRAIGQFIVLVVVTGLGVLVVRLVVLRHRPRAKLPASDEAQALETA